MSAFNSAIALVRNPVGFMMANKDSPATVRSIMVNYVAILAVIPFIATLIGDLWWYGLGLGIFFSGFVGFAIVSAILSYIFAVISVYVVGFVIKLLAPSFNSSIDQVKALKLAAYLYTPYFLISILDIIPFISVITVLGVLYGLYILYKGLPILLGTPADKVLVYLIVIVVATFIVYAIVGVIIAAVAAAFFFAGLGFFL